MSPKKKSPRTLRREAERANAKLDKDREKLSRLEAGGHPNHPIEVDSPSVIEAHAGSMPCGRCGGAVRVDEHTAEVIDGARVRVVRVRCAACGFVRSVYFRLGTTLLN